MKWLTRILYCVAALAFSASAHAAERGTAHDAVALVGKAIGYIKDHGREQAFSDFGKPDGAFRDRDLYIVVGDFEGAMLAHGGNPKIVGKTLMDIRDADGKYFVREIIAVAKAKGKGWVDYQWLDPVTRNIEHKSSYFEKVGDLIVMCGIYK